MLLLNILQNINIGSENSRSITKYICIQCHLVLYGSQSSGRKVVMTFPAKKLMLSNLETISACSTTTTTRACVPHQRTSDNIRHLSLFLPFIGFHQWRKWDNKGAICAKQRCSLNDCSLSLLQLLSAPLGSGIEAFVL